MLEPVAFATELDAYLDSLPAQDIRALVLRSIKHLDGAHRAQLALFLGLDVAGDPIDDVGGSAVDERQLEAFVDSCALLRERFGAFLRDNPQAIRALDRSVACRILGPAQSPFSRFLTRVPPKAIGLIALALLFMFVPLAAQYAHQTGMLAGLSEISIAPPRASVPEHVAFEQTRAAPVRHAAGTASAHAVRQSTRSHIAQRQHSHAHHTIVRVAQAGSPIHKHSHAHHRVIAGVWKFDRKYNPYFNHTRWKYIHNAPAVRSVAYSRPAPRPRPRMTPEPLHSGLEGRAQLLVSSYLHAVIAGNTLQALQHLGLPADAPASNVSESPIVTRDARSHVVSVGTQPDGRVRVEVDIVSRAGEYFETFFVAQDGPAVRIMDRFYIPVNWTAEERAARQLAKDGH